MTLLEFVADTGSSSAYLLAQGKVRALISLLDDKAPASDEVEESYLRDRLLFVLLQLQEQIENRFPNQTAWAETAST